MLKVDQKTGVVSFDNGSIDPKGFVGVKKDEFKKQFAGKIKGASIDQVWHEVQKRRPKTKKAD